MKFKLLIFILSGICLGTQCFAQSALVHIQGEKGSREAYFANFAVVMDRTPADKILGPTSVKQLETTIVYESPNKPEFSMLLLQFECVVKYAYDGKKIPKQPAFDAPVKVRVGENSWLLRRADLKSDSIPASDWRESDSPVLLKLQKIACNEDILRGAMIKAAKKNNDMNIFKKEIKKVGLPEDLQLVGQQIASEFLEFSWSVLWNSETRPDPSGKWNSKPTKEQLAEYKAKMDALQKQFNQQTSGMKTQLETNIKQMDAEFDFHKIAADIRAGRRVSKNETHMLAVWEGKTEKDVAIAMGAPIITDAGSLRFMSYGQEFDNRVVVGNMQGDAWEEGLYENCNVQFILHPDNNNSLRVADVRIWTNSNQIGKVTFACDGLLQVPN